MSESFYNRFYINIYVVPKRHDLHLKISILIIPAILIKKTRIIRFYSGYFTKLLSKFQNNLTELKSFGTPPEQVAMVAQAVLFYFPPEVKFQKIEVGKRAKR